MEILAGGVAQSDTVFMVRVALFRDENYDYSIELLQAFTAMVSDILADEEAPGTKVLQ